jgi:hypothetical protein
MPVRVIAAPGDTEQRAVVSAATSDWDETHARNGSGQVSVGALNTGNRHTQARKSGSNYVISRGVLAYDLRTAGLPGHIRIVSAHLHIGGTTASAGDTNGDKLRVGVITNPTNAGEVTIATTDYDLARYDSSSYTSAQAVATGVGARGAIVQLDNLSLLNHLASAINDRGVLYLGLRNELDFLDDASGVTGTNRVWFTPPGAQGGGFLVEGQQARLNIFYRVISNLKNTGGRDAGGVASAGFCTGNTFGGTNSGFGS